MTVSRFAIVAFGVLSTSQLLRADDWPQWMGPTRDGVWHEKGIVDSFPKDGPKKLWSVPVKYGYAGPAVAGGYVYVPDYDVTEGEIKNSPSAKTKLKGNERLLCLDAKTGNELWKHQYECNYEVSYPSGPRCTPTVDGDRVYTLGAMGDLYCVDAKSGKPIWNKSFVRDYQAETPIWGFAGHPFVYKDLLICLAGGKNALVVAFDKATGQEKWKALSVKEPGYCSPRVVEINGKPQLVLWYPGELVSLEPQTGKLNWTYAIKPMYGMSIMSPQSAGDELFLGGIGGVSAVVKAGDSESKEIWKGKNTTGIGPVNMTPLVYQDVIYGVDQPGAFRAVDFRTGKRLWSSMLPVTGKDVAETNISSGTAFLTRNGENYFLFSEQGDLIIAKLSPEAYTEVSRANLLKPVGEAFGRKVVWSHPAFADGCIFARNDSEIVCHSLKK